MDRVVQVPGWSNILTQPIINRIDMLSTGVRTRHRRQGVRPRPGYHRPRLQGDRAGAQAHQRAPATWWPSRSWARATWRSTSTARRRPATASASTTSRTRSRWPWAARSITQTVEGRDRFPVRAPLCPRLTARTRRRSSACWSAAAGGMGDAIGGMGHGAGMPVTGAGGGSRTYAAPGHAAGAAAAANPAARGGRRAHRRRAGHDQERERPAASTTSR